MAAPAFPNPTFHSTFIPNPVDVKKPIEKPHNKLIEELYGAARKPRSFKQWEDAAKESTLELKQHGSPSPLVWVLVRGKDIPANAIVAGEERRQPLYIARTFYEGGICIGKAGRHLPRGAAIPFNGLEVHVDSYEVLVPALHPVRYSISDTVHMPNIPRMLGETKDVPGVERLNLIKTVVLVDDSASMAGALWRDAREALAGIADLNDKASADGVDVYFMNDFRFGVNLKDGNEVRGLFDAVKPAGETPTGKKLQELFDTYLPLVEDTQRSHRPITIVVITDGVPTDDPREVIINAARRLDRNQIPLKRFGVQFAQIGDDYEATEALQELDDDLAAAHGIRDMVDTTPYDSNDRQFTSATMVKILLGAIDETLDAAASPQALNGTLGTALR
ncbi:hypothetical protein Hypma_006139 [Hypsizygus marmoreus]|uniref:VWFA domain-containing protein n=1 Tax=Hypsizygus marmoreus TaxID=39966 RepID=A0A369K2G4_HYPMA|nr:hypothetical protein Hypma_006139 [Hypsizygus marmoreus]